MNELKDMSLEELKAAAYDALSALEMNQNSLRMLNHEIQSRLMDNTSETTEEEVSPEVESVTEE